jgi:uncharacterized protein YdaU (DUF1376 family)
VVPIVKPCPNIGGKIMGDTPFIKFYPSDFLAGTSGLSPAERGVYITLLCLMYEADGPIVWDNARLARRCGLPKSSFIRVLDGLLSQGKLINVGDMLSNKRAEKAIVDRANRTQNSTHAANIKWSEQRGKGKEKQRQIDAGAMPPQCVADASQKPEPETRKETPLIPQGGRGRRSDNFTDVMREAKKLQQDLERARHENKS